MELSRVSLSPAALDGGVWIDSPRGWPDVRYRVRSFNYAPYVRARELLYTRLRREAGKKPVDPLLRDREIGRLIAGHLLIDWEGMTQDGKALPLSEALKTEVLTEAERAPLSEDILAAIGEAGEAQAEAESGLEKN